MMNTKEIKMTHFCCIHQGKPVVFFVKSVDFGKFVLSNYGKYLGINRKMKTTRNNVCHRRNASMNTQEWSS